MTLVSGDRITSRQSAATLVQFVAVVGAGLACGAGIVLAGLLDSQATRAFLDLRHLAGAAWDLRLVAVAVAAQICGLIGIRLAQKRGALPDPAAVSARSDAADRRLVAGALLFGAGLGLSGLGPAIAVAGLGVVPLKAAVVVAAAILGMRVADAILPRLTGPAPRAERPTGG